MDFHESWAEALKTTEIVRSRAALLPTFADAHVPYILLTPSSVNDGDTVVRRGQVAVQRPSLLLPPNIPRFEGFDFSTEQGVSENDVVNFLLVRGIVFPSMKYQNQTYSLDVFEGGLTEAVPFFANQLERREDVDTGLMLAREDVWPFALLIFICSQVARNTDLDIRRLMEEYRRRGES